MLASCLFRPGLEVVNLAVRLLGAVLPGPVAGTCAVCGTPVRTDDPYVRYRGRAFHAEPCAERHPPAEWTAREDDFRTFAF